MRLSLHRQRGEIDLAIAAILFLCLGLGCAIAFGIYQAVQADREWAAYAGKHHCRVVARHAGSVATGVAVGKSGAIPVTVVSDSQTTYLCDDGVYYTRND